LWRVIGGEVSDLYVDKITMPLRILFRYLVNNQQLIDKLAESYPMRRAAQLGAYLFFRGQALRNETIEKLKESDAKNRLESFSKTFSDELREGFRRLKDQKKD
jgi:N-formylglutamate amidohydrolase